MRDTYEIGSSPNGEDCAQVGSADYRERSQRECRAYVNQLNRAYPNMPSGMYLKITSHPHDFGTYHEVSCVYDDENEEHCDFLFGNLENGCEKWDEEARKELGLDNPEESEEGKYVSPQDLGFDPEDPDTIEEIVFSSVVPACCSSGCEVEPDGRCQHGHPSVLIALGIM
jgi:hypothetical protein